MDFEGYENIPETTQFSLSNYFLQGWEPGGFLTRVLAHADFPNDHWYWDSEPVRDVNGGYMYEGAAGSADPGNRRALREIHRWVVDKLPPECWGSYDKVHAYCRYIRSL